MRGPFRYGGGDGSQLRKVRGVIGTHRRRKGDLQTVRSDDFTHPTYELTARRIGPADVTQTGPMFETGRFSVICSVLWLACIPRGVGQLAG